MAEDYTLEYEESSGNIFADLDFPNAEEHMAKVELAHKINQVIQKRDLKQAEAAQLLGTTQAKISLLNKGRLKDFSLERLLKYLIKLDLDIKIIVKSKPRSHPNATISVSAA